MKMQILTVSIATLFVMANLSGCSNKAPRITPGSLQTSGHVSTHSAKITNIVQLSKKEAPAGKVILGGLTGAIVGNAVTHKASDTTQDIAGVLGADVGVDMVTRKYGKTIYRLTLKLNNGAVKKIHVRGGDYIVGGLTKVTVNKASGNITSLLVLKA